ncbi:hypothetical protein FACS189441_1870 [Betaproteobacteria bacterium]|nr:hypothetical protein FACS189441_1870 [Betaproteobacteria bacterium]
MIGNTDKDIYKGISHTGGPYGGANAAANSVTLLSINDDFGSSAFRASGAGITYQNEYQGSDLQGAMDAIAGGLGKEQGVINARDLKSIGITLPPYESGNFPNLNNADGINGADAGGQMFWALSYPEWRAIADTGVSAFTSVYWLRSPGNISVNALTGKIHFGYAVSSSYLVRPAFNLDLKSVLFASDASTSGSGKSAATTTNGYQSAAQPTSGVQKFTFLTSSIATPTLTLNATPLTFTLADAPTVDSTAPSGAKQYVSGFLTKDTTTDFYARYLETTSSVPSTPFNAADSDGGGSPLDGGNYTLHIFSEEANDYQHSDFASEAVDFTFTMNNGAVEALTLTSNSAFGLDGGNIALGSGTFNKAWSLANGSVLNVSSATFNPSSLNVRGKDNTITGDLTTNGGALNFYLPSGIDNNDTLLTVTGNANIGGSAINIAQDGSFTSFSNLVSGNKINLIEAGGTLSGVGTYPSVTLSAGVTFTSYDFSIAADGNKLVATTTVTPPPVNPLVTTPPGVNLNPQTKALAEGFLSGTAFLNQAQDFAAERGIHSALAQTVQSDTHGFAAIGYSTLRHNTGSHVDVDGYTLLAGLAATTPTQTGNLTAAAFIEHGEGNYDSYNSFSNAAKVHGKGDTQYTGAGILARFAFNESNLNNLYLDASLRSGKVKTDFSGNLYDGFGRAAAYNAKSTYVSAHLGAGYILKLSEQSKLDVYGQYLWSHQNGDTVKLTTGETVKFKAVDSQRTRLGVKWHHALTTKTTAYFGAAWEHEYNGKAKASIYGYKLDAPELKGDTGLLEAGLTVTPTTANKQGWSLDLGVQGYAGKREGVTGSLRARYRF